MKFTKLAPLGLWVVTSALLLSACASQVESPPLEAESLRATFSAPVPVQQYTAPKAERWSLPNGLTVLFLQDNEVPLVRGALYLKGGSLMEPEDKSGVTAALGVMMRLGGAGARAPAELDIDLQKLSASVGSGFGPENGTMTFSCLSSDFDKVFGIFSDVVLRPRLDPTRLELWRGQSLEGLKRRKDDPNSIAGVTFAQLSYQNQFFGRVFLSKDVRAITRGKLSEMHSHLVRPEGAILAVAGAISRTSLEQAVNAAFARWKPRGSPLAQLSKEIKETPGGVYFIKAPFSQSTVYLGHLGVERLPPDQFAIEAFNSIFGTGGFGSKLMQRIRTQLGLAYATYGAITPAVVRGQNVIILQTKAQSTGEALTESVKILEEMKASEVSSSELQESLQAIGNSFIFRFDTPDDAVQRQALIQLLEYPADYDESYLKNIREVSAAQVRSVAQRRWDPTKFVVVVVGNESAYANLMETLKSAPPWLAALPVHQGTFGEMFEESRVSGAS